MLKALDLKVLCTVVFSLGMSGVAAAQQDFVEVAADAELGWGKRITLPDGRSLITAFNVLPGIENAIDTVQIPVEHQYLTMTVGSDVRVIRDLVTGYRSIERQRNGVTVTFEFSYSSDALPGGQHTLTASITGIGSPVKSTYYFSSRDDLTLQRSITSTDCIFVADDICLIANAIVGDAVRR